MNALTVRAPSPGARPGGGRRRRLPRCAAGTVLVCALLAGCSSHTEAEAHFRPWRTITPAPRSPAAVTASPAARPAPPPRRVSSDVSVASLDRLLGQAPGHVAVAVEDLAGGRTLVRGASARAFVSASIAKVDILAALLLERQDAGATGLNAGQRALATRMIQASDNACADRLFRQAGGAWGIGRANRRFGLTGTAVHTLHWGLTTTTAGDQLRLLQQIFTSRSALTPASRSFIQRLMGQVEADQDWGVSAAADGRHALKNGWLPRPDGTWTVNSIGGVRHRDHLLLIAVLSDHDPSESAGITLIQTLARAGAQAVTGA
ncbi:serine hydrolase [Streptacidiphilus rugosus]|uniref:serine hydrolase n=1 Tax=Streptacidiphilus rugosus TaxID=405783 RepID=UPI000ABB37C6|nr:serine hydrolase [Streptacidiphilus rugosus]